MKIKEIYEYIVRQGIAKDPRPKNEIASLLKKEKKTYSRLKRREREVYDMQKLSNPYSDTRILYGDPAQDVVTVFVGIDMEAPELILADRLNEKGASIDMVIAHHPEGIAWAGLDNVMGMQASILSHFGVAKNIADDLLKDRMAEVSRSISPANHARSVDVARLLNMPFMCAHTPADNHVVAYLEKLFASKKPVKLGRVLELLNNITEYKEAAKQNAPPKILLGDPDKDAGKIFVDMTGGTEGPKKIFGRLSQAGVGTIVAMHFSEEHYKLAKEERMNVIIAGHIASDSLGLNLLLDGLEKKGLKILTCSGFTRVGR